MSNSPCRRRVSVPDGTSGVYCFRDGPDGLVKIGSAKCIRLRRRKLQTGNPRDLLIVWILSGGEAEELAIHALFKSHRGRGEWFTPTPEILAFGTPISELAPAWEAERVRAHRAKTAAETAARPVRALGSAASPRPASVSCADCSVVVPVPPRGGIPERCLVCSRAKTVAYQATYQAKYRLTRLRRATGETLAS